MRHTGCEKGGYKGSIDEGTGKFSSWDTPKICSAGKFLCKGALQENLRLLFSIFIRAFSVAKFPRFPITQMCSKQNECEPASLTDF